jgi:hypothetical protein
MPLQASDVRMGAHQPRVGCSSVVVVSLGMVLQRVPGSLLPKVFARPAHVHHPTTSLGEQTSGI